MIALLVFLALAVALWLGWRVEEIHRMERETRERMFRAQLEYDRWRGTSDREGKLDRAKVKADTELEITRLSLQQPVARSAALAKDIQIPDDLTAWVMSWNDEFAQDDWRGHIRSKYLELHTGDAGETWQRVRRSIGIGEMPT